MSATAAAAAAGGTDLCQICKTAASKYKCSLCRLTRYCSLVCYNKHKAADGDCPKRPSLSAPQNDSAAAAAAAAAATATATAAVPLAPALAATTAPATASATTAGSAPPSASTSISAVAMDSTPAARAVAATAASTSAAASASASRLTSTHIQNLLSSESIRRSLSSTELRSIITRIDTAPNREWALQHALTNNTDLAQFVNELLATIHGETTNGMDDPMSSPAAAAQFIATAIHSVAATPTPTPSAFIINR